jgi:hypothetical protein
MGLVDFQMRYGTSAFTSSSLAIYSDYSIILFWYYIQAQGLTHNQFILPIMLISSTFLIVVLGLSMFSIISNSVTTMVRNLDWRANERFSHQILTIAAPWLQR